MKKSLISLPLMLTLALLTLTTGCGGRGPLEKAIKSALVAGDTTQARFDSICGIIAGNPDRYSDYVTGGDVDVNKLSALIDEIGASLRPPMHWNTSAYGLKQLSLTVYLERSGSMVPYDTRDGGGQLKKAVNDIINAFPATAHTTINIVNDGIYPYQGSVQQFLQDRDIYASTASLGNPSHTDFGKIFSAILQAQRPGNVSVLVSDLIYSPADASDVSVEKIFNEENSLATQVFRNYVGKSIIVTKLMGDYHGKYYPYDNQAYDYHGQRPFYVMVIADSKVIDAMATDPQYARVVALPGDAGSYRFNQGSSEPECSVVPDWKDNAGRFRIAHRGLGMTACQADRTTGVMCFTVAADLSALHQPDSYLCQAANYDVQSLTGFTLTVKPITRDMFTNNNQSYLQGKTHLLTFTGNFRGPKDDVQVSLRNQLPTWIEQSTSRDDRRGADPHFAGTTLGLSQLLNGIFTAFSGKGDGTYFNLTIHLDN